MPHARLPTALALLIAATYAMSNLVADLSYAALDPRIRLA